MKEYIDSYEKDLTNSTELVNEASKKEKLLQRTLTKVFNRFRLTSLLTNGKPNPNYVGKREGDYNIRIRVQQMKSGFFTGANQELHIKVTDADTDEPIDGLPELAVVKIKSSWDEEKIADEINDALSDYRIELTGTNGKIGGAGSVNDTTYAGFTGKQILTAFKNSNLSLNDQKRYLKSLVSAWDNLSLAQQAEFKKLYEKLV